MDLEPCDSHTVSDQPCEGRRDAIVLIRAHQGQEPDSITACTVHAAAARRQCAAGPPFVGGQCPWCGPDHDEPDPGLPCDSHTASDEPCDGIRDAVLLRPDSAPAGGTTACPTHAAAIMATTSGWQAHPGPGDPTGWWAATAMSWSQGVESVWVPPAPGNII